MKNVQKIDLGLTGYDELFANDEERRVNKLPRIFDIPISEIDDFPDHPFKVKIDEDMDQLVQSIKEHGIITPVTLRPKEDGRYEIVSGHRRKKACELAGLNTVKAEVRVMSRDEAIILMVESNLQRSTILPSEKAFSYKMRLEAMKRQAGRPSKENSSPVGIDFRGKQSLDVLGDEVGDSRNQVHRYIYIYDISGEMFSSSSDFQSNQAYSYADGFIFIIDPLTLSQFTMEVVDKIDLNAYGASAKDFDDILNIMLINLEKMFGLKDNDTLKRNLAVVINKVDVPTLEEKIGETAAQQYLAEHADTCKSYMDARDAVCRNFLMDYGAGNFVRTAEAKFRNIRYFTCSALGHNHEGQPFEGKNVVDPLLWLLNQADSSIKAE